MNYLRRPGGPESVETAFLDYQLEEAERRRECRAQGEEGLALWAELIESLAHVEIGKTYLEEQLAEPDSLTRKALRVVDNADLEELDAERPEPETPSLDPAHWPAAEGVRERVKRALSVTEKSYKAVESLLSTLARPFAEANRHWDEVRPMLERLYGVRITEQALSYSVWRRIHLPGPPSNFGSQLAIAVKPEAGVSGRADPPVRVINFNGISVLSQRSKEFLDRVPIRFVNAIQVISLTMSWRDLVENGVETRADQFAMIQTLLDTVATAIALRQVYVGMFRPELATSMLTRTLGATIGLGANVFGVLSDLEKMGEQNDELERQAAGSYAVSAAGTAIAIAGMIITLSNPAGWILILAGTVVTIGGILSLNWTLPTPMDLWLQYCTFGKYPYGEGFAEAGGQMADDAPYPRWADDPEAELYALYRLIYSVVAQMHWRPRERPVNGLSVMATLRNFDPDHGRVYLSVRVRETDGEGEPRWRTLTDREERFRAGVVEQLSDEERGFLTLSWRLEDIDLPRAADYAVAQVTLDPYGNGRYLLPDEHGMRLTATRYQSSPVTRSLDLP
ncbi:hypothetical protein [Alkalilimnicola ehrlichii]|uniref:Uncharacterized protein n=1 Tax=Alkalilimnicola ehrlichii TaxID=351052 RepID=A0A3E0WRD2_9GAMM|nr:hypothetical protein [Alkalilimnicola ehrlichii]RFA35398.1 hypothetical protein CAL65_13035 [Alkalilimnicola ehrlichii]